MQGENYLESELQPTGNPAARSKSNKTTILIWAHAITFLLGVGVLAFVVYKIGYSKIIEILEFVGWAFFVIAALNIIRHLARSLSLYLAIAPEQRATLKYRSVVAARFGGEAVSFLSFTGPFLGDATKAVLLRKNLPLTYGASAVISDNILYYLSVILMILAGVAAFDAVQWTPG